MSACRISWRGASWCRRSCSTSPRREALAEATLKQLHDETNRRTLTEIFTEMHHVLKQNTAQRAAEVVASVIEKPEGAAVTAARAPRRKTVAGAAAQQVGLNFETPDDVVCGVDEAGRGPLAGPVVAAAVIFDPSKPMIRGLDDSKVLTREKARRTVRQDRRPGARLLHRVGIGRGNRYAQYPARHHAGDEARGGRPVRRRRRWCKIDGNRCPTLSVRSRSGDRRRRAGQERSRRRRFSPRSRATGCCSNCIRRIPSTVSTRTPVTARRSISRRCASMGLASIIGARSRRCVKRICASARACRCRGEVIVVSEAMLATTPSANCRAA